ncbi:hypothetical protein OCK74_00600 [Chitinophagaceae bacterium LB-8]|uniref:Uncharacterized protein n=1 Tax=Paraflavisolibacter caeni TaxID=2982496 RepID=A0A9X2XS78_9BACT|nr:hypothetical protein [Paraflavisolibacter caeni]MCU7547585.1 hypothetical protein [Paraflavisolibacter caeni]
MRFPIKAILAGLIIGAALFFIPFGFPFLFFFFFIFFIARFFFWRPWGMWSYGYGPRWPYRGSRFRDDIIPIDGQFPGQAGVSREGEKRITIQ